MASFGPPLGAPAAPSPLGAGASPVGAAPMAPPPPPWAPLVRPGGGAPVDLVRQMLLAQLGGAKTMPPEVPIGLTRPKPYTPPDDRSGVTGVGAPRRGE